MTQAIVSGTQSGNVTSAYAQYKESRGVDALSFYADAKLVDITKQAARARNMKHVDYMRMIVAQAVRADGFDYVEETKESLKQQNERMQREIAEMRAQLANTKTKEQFVAEAAARVAAHTAR